LASAQRQKVVVADEISKKLRAVTRLRPARPGQVNRVQCTILASTRVSQKKGKKPYTSLAEAVEFFTAEVWTVAALKWVASTVFQTDRMCGFWVNGSNWSIGTHKSNFTM
jgi:hypothetical protein